MNEESTSVGDFIFPTFRFEVVLHLDGMRDRSSSDGSEWRAAFSEISGLESQLEVVELQEGGYLRGVRRLVGKRSNPDLVLKRGLTLNAGFWNWLERATGARFGSDAGSPWPLPYMSGEVIVHRAQVGGDKDRVGFKFWNALPSKVVMPSLQAIGGTQVAIEELHLRHEGLERV